MDQREVLRAVAAYGLPGRDAPVVTTPLDDAGWRSVRDGVRHQRLTGHASLAADDGALALTDVQREELQEDHFGALAHVLRLERDLLGVEAALTGAGVPFVVLKGTAVAHLDYADASLRTFGDNDVLLPTDRFSEGMDVLLGIGFVRPVAELNAGFDVRFGKGATLKGPHTELDVHRTLAMGPFGLLLRLEELWEDPRTLEIGGRRLRALGQEQRLLHACFHAAIGNASHRLVPYRDVAEMLLYGDHDLDRFGELAASWSAEAVVARALVDTWSTLGITERGPLVEWATRRRPSRRDTRLLGVYGSGSSYAAKALAGLTVLPSWRDRVDYARMLLLPGHKSLEARGRSRRSWLLGGARRLARDARSAARSRWESRRAGGR